jgi:uncharacterized protein Usg
LDSPASSVRSEGKLKTMSFVRQLQDYRLTTAEILYHLPDHPNLLQSFIWQDLDIAPRYPVLHKFLDFWKREIEGSLHSVRVASASLVKPATVGHVDALLRLHEPGFIAARSDLASMAPTSKMSERHGLLVTTAWAEHPRRSMDKSDKTA